MARGLKKPDMINNWIPSDGLEKRNDLVYRFRLTTDEFRDTERFLQSKNEVSFYPLIRLLSPLLAIYAIVHFLSLFEPYYPFI